MSISRGGSLVHVEANALGYIRGRRLNEPLPSQLPTLNEVQPTSGLATGGTAITALGTNLIGTTSFTLDTTACTSVVVAADGNSLTAVSPSHAAGSVSATVTTPLGSATLPDAFRYTAVAANPPPSVSYLIVAGGGAGGTTDTGANAPAGTALKRVYSSGGGAGGGVMFGTISVAKGISYPVGIGAGGESINLTGRQGGSGGNSSFRGLVAKGGGGGGGGINNPDANVIPYGAAGGSSGGGSALDLVNTLTSPTLGYNSLPTNINNQGNIGGQGYSIKTLDPINPVYRSASGGGGGKNEVGSSPTGSNGFSGYGGTGLVSASIGTVGSGGGGGRVGFTAIGGLVAGGTGGGSGASGGLVNGSADTGAMGTNATMAGGGGGGSYTNEVGTFKKGGNGYRGAVVIRYSSSYDQLIDFDTDYGNTYTLDGSSHVYVISQSTSIIW